MECFANETKFYFIHTHSGRKSPRLKKTRYYTKLQGVTKLVRDLEYKVVKLFENYLPPHIRNTAKI